MSFIEGPHPLLEDQAPPYTNATVRRAFIVWMHCGQRNCFKDVCNYYHHLESLEDKLPADRRAASRHLEFNMFSNPPPTSPYLNQIFPQLYIQNNTIKNHIKHVEVKHDNSIFDGFNDGQTQNGVSTNEILETSNMIKKYCKSHMTPLRKFLAEFKEFTRKCNLSCTINNVVLYIKRKMVEEELLMVENYSKCLSFLNLNIEKADHVLTEKTSHKHVETNFMSKMSEDQLKFLCSLNADKYSSIMTRHERELMNQYWNDLTTDMTIRNSTTRTW